MAAEPGFDLRESVPLAPMTTLGIGGPARWFATASADSHVLAARSWSDAHGVPLLVVGGGSNLVVADEGFQGLVLRMAIRGVSFEAAGDETRVRAGAGESWDDVVAAAVVRGLAGIECLSGIPGTVGGTPIQNVGAYGQEVSDTIECVTAFDTGCAAMVTLRAVECGFSYRMSRFKSEGGRYTVTGVAFRLRPGAAAVRYPDLSSWLERAGVKQPTLGDVRQAVIAVRRTKGMVIDIDDPDSRSVGSFFMNPSVSTAMRDGIAEIAGQSLPAFPMSEGFVKIPAAWLIEHAGFHKGYADGSVAISSKHPLALVNRGGATARDVLRLAIRIKRHVADRFGVLLKPEPNFIGFADDPDVTYLQHDLR